MDVMDIVEPQNYKFKVRIGVGPVVEVMNIVEPQNHNYVRGRACCGNYGYCGTSKIICSK